MWRGHFHLYRNARSFCKWRVFERSLRTSALSNKSFEKLGAEQPCNGPPLSGTPRRENGFHGRESANLEKQPLSRTLERKTKPGEMNVVCFKFRRTKLFMLPMKRFGRMFVQHYQGACNFHPIPLLPLVLYRGTIDMSMIVVLRKSNLKDPQLQICYSLRLSYYRESIKILQHC